MMLRNAANVFAVQNILGHTTLHMTRRYLALTESDILSAHKRASPAYNLR
jgi:site-specific recombinase XerD